MKKIGEIVQEGSLTPYEDLGGIAKPRGKRTLTPSAGSGTGDTNALTTTRPRPQADDVRAILWKLSTIKPWQISHDDQKGVKTALDTLAWATIPATIDEAVYWLTRLLAHFPRRDSTQDAVVVADLAADMFDAGVSLIAMVATCDDVRKAATSKNPWLPPSGEILKTAVERTESYKAQIDRLQNPKLQIAAPKAQEAPPPPWQGFDWENMPETARSELWAFLTPLDVSIRRTYCRVIGQDYDIIESFFNQAGKVDHENSEENPEQTTGDHEREDRDNP